MRRAGAALLFALALGTAHAGRSCEPAPLAPETARQAFDLAYKVRGELDRSGAQVALIGRVGQDLSRYGQRYSHLAYAWRDHPAGRWNVVHELNECGTAQSALFDEGLANFFLDNMFAFEAVVTVPDAATQAKLAELLAGRLPLDMHEARYNMLAYPFSVKYQNSNQWVLEVYAAAVAPASKMIIGRGDAHAWLGALGYRPDTIELRASERLGARLFRANVAFDDHPFDRRMAGKIDTVTVGSVLAFIARNDPQSRRFTVTLP